MIHGALRWLKSFISHCNAVVQELSLHKRAKLRDEIGHYIGLSDIQPHCIECIINKPLIIFSSRFHGRTTGKPSLKLLKSNPLLSTLDDQAYVITFLFFK
jgi:hypothetical protein